MPVSRKRWLLAIYLDLAVFSAAWGLILHFVAPGREFALLRSMAFGLLEAMLLGLVRWSPGEYLLSITVPSRRDDSIVRRAASPMRQGAERLSMRACGRTNPS
jgi:hypothetical protein